VKLGEDNVTIKVSGKRFRMQLKKYKNLRVIAKILLTLLLVSCSAKQYPELPPSTTVGSSTESYDYIIGAGDTLSIYLWGYDDLQDTVPVRPDGQITTKLVEDLTAAGKTPSELARELETAYAEFVNNPVATVSISEFSGNRDQQVRIIGSSAEPTSVPFNVGMTLLDLLIEAGGVGEFASGNRATLIRSADGERKNYSLRIDDLVRKGDISANVELHPGDVVLIPESWF